MAPPLRHVQVPLDDISSLEHTLVPLATLLRVHLAPLSMSATKMLNNASPHSNPQELQPLYGIVSHLKISWVLCARVLANETALAAFCDTVNHIST